MTALLESYAAPRNVPKLPGARVAKCGKCSKWATFPKRYKTCYGCQPSEIGKARLRDAVATLELAAVKPSTIPLAEVRRLNAAVSGTILCRKLAAIEAIRRDSKNIKKADLTVSAQQFWL